MFFANKSVWTTLQYYIIIQVQIIFYCYHFKVLSCCACRSIFLVCVSFPVFVFFIILTYLQFSAMQSKLKMRKFSHGHILLYGLLLVVHSHLYKNIPNRENSFNIIFFFFFHPGYWVNFTCTTPHRPPTAALPLDLAEQTFVMKSPALLWSSSRAEFRPSVPIATRDLSAVKQEVPLNPCVNGFDP